MKHWEEVVSVKPIDNHILDLTFANGERKTYDMAGHFDRGVFKKLKEPLVFNSARVEYGTVVWAFGLDIAHEELYWNGTPIGQTR